MNFFLLIACRDEVVNQANSTSLKKNDAGVMTCNGSAELCARRLDEVAMAATHNSMSSAERDWFTPNQEWSITTQLRDGVRGLNLDTYLWEGEATLCHTFCELGQQPLHEAFEEIESFIQQYPNNVIVLTFEDSISATETMYAFEQANIKQRLYIHEPDAPWPTLHELINAQTQIIAFAANDGGNLDGYHSQWEHWLDTPYSAQTPDDFACIPDRGDINTATLFNINHFLTAPIASPLLAEKANDNTVLWDHIHRCMEETSLFPNQVLVDFYSIGDIFSVINRLNEISSK